MEETNERGKNLLDEDDLHMSNNKHEWCTLPKIVEKNKTENKKIIKLPPEREVQTRTGNGVKWFVVLYLFNHWKHDEEDHEER